jgi:hypothetical protein
VAFTASPIRDEAAKTIGTIIEVRDITEEKRDRRARELLMREVDHRARNALFVVQSMLELTKGDDIQAYKEAALGRIGAIARAQDSLAQRRWHGAPLREVLTSAVSAWLSRRTTPWTDPTPSWRQTTSSRSAPSSTSSPPTPASMGRQGPIPSPHRPG